MLDLRPLKIVVTGGTGFVGRHLVSTLLDHGCNHVASFSRANANLLNYGETLNGLKVADIVFHLAALCGGIGANQARPADFIMQNLQMGMNVIRASSANNVGKVIIVGTLCAFPKDTDGPITTADLWSGYPEETNAPYGIAKRTLCEVGKAYHQQYELNVLNVMPTNMYGPGDNFDPQTSHVIPALIRRFTEARDLGLPEVTCWGTGAPTRDFLHVEDAVHCLIRAAAVLDDPEPVCLGSGVEVSMRDIATMIADIVGYSGRVLWDTSKPDGQPRRVVDTTEQTNRLSFEPQVALEEGLRQTIEWYWNGTAQPLPRKLADPTTFKGSLHYEQPVSAMP